MAIRPLTSGLWRSALLLILAVSSPLGAEPVPLVPISPAGEIAPGGRHALTMPSAAVRLPERRWAILDGVNNRIVVTDDAGAPLATLGEGLLQQPLGLTVGPDGRLWVADSGRHRVVALTPAGDLSAEVAMPASGGHPADPVDLAFDRDGRTLLVVDNDNDCVVELDAQTLAWGRRWGRTGTELDQMHHPFSIAVGPEGERAVVDVINSRVLCHDPEYDFTFQIGSWGVDAGNLYRPKGVAFDAQGRVWVSDSVLGVIQVFSGTGELIGVAADGDRVRHFEAPTRLAFDERGRLAVVEMLANRVTLWRVAP